MDSSVTVRDTASTSLVDVVRDHSKIQLDVGCGGNKRPGWVGLDIRPLPGVDIVHDIEDFPWPLPDDCARVIQLSHIIEHIPPVGYRLEVIRGGPDQPVAGYPPTDPVLYPIIDVKLHRTKPHLELMDELHRILEPSGQVWITCPYGWSHGFVQDPTHAKPINEDYFEYFTPVAKTKALSGLYNIYTPKPWEWVTSEYDTGGNLLTVLRTIKEKEVTP